MSARAALQRLLDHEAVRQRRGFGAEHGGTVRGDGNGRMLAVARLLAGVIGYVAKA